MDDLLLLFGGLWSVEDTAGGGTDDVEKYVFGYPAGKSRMKKGLVRMISPHKTYVEPFAGSAAVFFGKEKSGREVLNDTNAEVMDAFKAIQSLSKREAAQLLKMNWIGDRRTFKSILASKPGGKLAKLHRFLYIASHSYGLMRRSWSPSNQGHKTGIAKRAIGEIDRLKGVTFRSTDYAAVVKEFDAKDTFFFFDPPYAGYNVAIGEKTFDEKKFIDVLKGIKGRFIVTYGVKGKADFSKFKVQRVAQYRSISTMRGVNRDKVLGTLIITNYDGSTYKAFGDEIEVESPKLVVDMAKFGFGFSGEGGSHMHFVDRKKKETANDGAHSHLYRLDGGEILFTLSDGPHQHKLKETDANKTEADGGHKHKVRLFDGNVLETEESKGHDHEIMARGRTSLGGIHVHDLKLPAGTKLTSLTPGEVEAATMKNADPYFEAPTDSEKRIATLKARFVDDQVFGDLWIDTGNHAIGWSLLLQESAVAKSGAMESFSVDGSRGVMPLTRGVAAKQIGVLDNGIHKVDGEVEGGKITQVDACYVEHGLHTEFEREYFLSKGRELFGVLRIMKTQGGWRAWISKTDLVPRVLKSHTGMPPAGISAMPASLADQIPKELRFWTAKGSVASDARDMLVASRFATIENLALVNGEIRKVERSIELYEPTEPDELDAEWHLKKIDDHHTSPLEEHFSTGDVVKSKSNVAFYDLSASTEEEALTQLDVFKASDNEFAISCLDSADLRESLSKHGRPFRFVPDHPAHAAEVCKRIFVASFPLTRTDDVEWLDKADVEKPFGGFDDFDDCVSSIMTRDGVDADAAARICGALQSETEKRDDDDEEPTVDLTKRLSAEITVFWKKDEAQRLVTGIVLEPETTDSQKDIYSEDEVRKAALGFMEEFQNMGLMHKKLVNGKVKLVESFIARSAFKEGGQSVKKGTWLITVRIIDDALWKSVKSGELTGFSIGGSAVRTPEK